MNTSIERQKRHFWSLVDKSTGCWNWRGCIGPGGYGMVYLLNWGHMKSHRMSWIFSNGEIPNGKFILHACDNRACVNPSHLWRGTAKENTDDMVKKGRHSHGESHPVSKLTENQVREIKKSKDNSANISKKFGIHFCTVRRIIAGKSWKHIRD